MADIVAGENGTMVAFYDMRELSQTCRPEKASELYNEAMEDIFRVLTWLEDHADTLEKQVARLKAELAARKRGGAAAAKKTAKKPPAKKPAKKPAKRPRPEALGPALLRTA